MKRNSKEAGIQSFLSTVALKQRVGKKEADKIALPTLIYLDSVARGQGGIAAENSLVKLVVMTQIIANLANNRAFYEIAVIAGQQLLKACKRQEEMLRFTTGELKAMRKMVSAYLRILPLLEVKALATACMQSEAMIGNLKAA